MREQVISVWKNGGMDALRTPRLVALRHQHQFPRLDSCKMWTVIFQTEGHVLPKRHNVKKYSEHEIQRQDLANLVILRLVHPKALIDEVRAYVHNRNPAIRSYSPSQICRAEERLGLWLKVTSTTSNEAYRLANLHKRNDYWGEA